METLFTLANKLMTGVSLATAMGVFMHDGRVDRAAMVAIERPTNEVVPIANENLTKVFKSFFKFFFSSCFY
jgi:hypothetical protein